ncbi:MAG: M23 family metallopeptidase [Bacteroidota bacterium]
MLVFFTLSFVVALAGYAWYIRNEGTFEELLLKQENKTLQVKWDLLEERLKKANDQLANLIEKDDHTYRIILDSNPLEANIREAGTGGSEKSYSIYLKELNEFPSILTSYQWLEKLRHQVDVETQSYDEILLILNDKMAMWASRPAIQPVNNSQLDRLHLTYGARMHPIFKVWKDHKGLDFAAALGTPVYATGDGKVAMAYFSGSYGNVVYINHGYDFETRYAHLSTFAVAPGDIIKRGQVIGYVGNTGTSVSSHLHYEILFKGQHVNPINFFQRDLSNQEYEKLILEGSKNTAPLD